MQFVYDWPYVALLLGVVSSLFLLRSPRIPSASWYLTLALPFYLVHQFEEHGVDAQGNHFAFMSLLCDGLGYSPSATGSDSPSCPANPAFIAAVNVGGVWIAGVLAAVFAESWPKVGAGFLGLIGVNVVAHVVGTLRARVWYTAGLASAFLLFVPLFAGGIRALLRDKVVAGCGGLMVVGLLMHAVIIVSLLAKARGWISDWLLDAIQVLNGFTVLSTPVIAW